MYLLASLLTCCPPVPLACMCGELRLSGSDSYYEGRVEVCSEGVLETVIPCDENWQDIHAQVVCQQLGFFNPGEAWLMS